MSLDIVRDLSSKDITLINKDQLLEVLKSDLLKYENLLNSSDQLPEPKLIELFNLSSVNNLEIISELKRFTNAKSNEINFENKDSKHLTQLQIELSKYFDKLTTLQTKMNAKLDEILKERDELFVKCQLLLDSLENN